MHSGCSADLGLHCVQALASPDKATGMSPVEEHAVYSKGDQGWGAGSSSVGGTLLEMDEAPDVRLDAAGPSTVTQLGSASSSEVGNYGNIYLGNHGGVSTSGVFQLIHFCKTWLRLEAPGGHMAVQEIRHQ